MPDQYSFKMLFMLVHLCRNHKLSDIVSPKLRPKKMYSFSSGFGLLQGCTVKSLSHLNLLGSECNRVISEVGCSIYQHNKSQQLFQKRYSFLMFVHIQPVT